MGRDKDWVPVILPSLIRSLPSPSASDTPPHPTSLLLLFYTAWRQAWMVGSVLWEARMEEWEDGTFFWKENYFNGLESG